MKTFNKNTVLICLTAIIVILVYYWTNTAELREVKSMCDFQANADVDINMEYYNEWVECEPFLAKYRACEARKRTSEVFMICLWDIDRETNVGSPEECRPNWGRFNNSWDADRLKAEVKKRYNFVYNDCIEDNIS